MPSCILFGFKKLFVLFAISLLIFLSIVSPVVALTQSQYEQLNTDSTDNSNSKDLLYSDEEILQEVPPLEMVQRISKELEQFHPKINFLSPTPDEVLSNNKWDLILEVNDWPISNDSQFGLGPHVVIQLDNDPLVRVVNSYQNKIRIPMKPLSPGSHRLSAYAAFPWGESVKKPDASKYIIIHSYKQLKGTQPDENKMWVTPIINSHSWENKPFLIDYLIWNTPLQGLRDGDNKWKVKITVNSTSFYSDEQEAIWISPFLKDINLVQIQLLDQNDIPLEEYINNKLILVENKNLDQPFWMKEELSEEEMKKFLGLN